MVRNVLKHPVGALFIQTKARCLSLFPLPSSFIPVRHRTHDVCERLVVGPGLSAKSFLTLSPEFSSKRETIKASCKTVTSALNIVIMRRSWLIRPSVHFKMIKGGMLRVVGGLTLFSGRR